MHEVPRIESNLNLVHKLAWKYSRTSGVDLVDLVAEGYHALCYADSKYDDGRNQAKFSTYAYTAIQSRLINLVKSYHRIGYYEVEIERYERTDSSHEHSMLQESLVDSADYAKEKPMPDPNAVDVESYIDFHERVRDLSKLAQRVCKLVFIGIESGGFTRRFTNKKEIKSRLKQEGYRKCEILSAFTEVAGVVE